MRIIKKCIEAIREGVFFEKVIWSLLIRTKVYKLIGLKQIINEKKIIFSNFCGLGYGDNPKAIAEYILTNNLDYDLVWLIDKKKDNGLSVPNCIRKVDFFSIEALKELATAKIWIDNCRKSYFPKKKKGQVYIQTWHGSLALKKIEADAPFLPRQYVQFAKKDSKVIDVILSGCEFKSSVFKNSFWYSGDVLNIGTPRADVFFNESKILENKYKVMEFYKIARNTKIVMYAPTFRQSHDLDIYKLDYNQLEKALIKKFGGDWKILVRLHPNIAYCASELDLPSTVINVTNYKDMQELLCTSDIVISDYSGLMFDFYIMNRPLFLFCTDFDEYTSKDRELYFNMEELPFTIAKNNTALCENVLCFEKEKYLNTIQNFKKKIGFCEEGTACERLFNWINTFNGVGGEYNGK